MKMMSVDKLHPHRKNGYFFDEISGEPWSAFLESVETSGIIEPIIVDAGDMTIVSGHQRVRACKELGIKEIPVEERHFDSEDERLKQLIEVNIRQRGIGNANPVKFGRCIAELERIYGIKNGRPEKVAHNEPVLTQDDLSEQLNISKAQLKRYKSLTDLIPELQDAVQTGKITATTAMGFVKKLSPEEQKQLAESISGKEKVSSKDVEKQIAEIKSLKAENNQLHRDNRTLAKQLHEEQSKELKVIKETVEVKVIPDDYEDLKQQEFATAIADLRLFVKRYGHIEIFKDVVAAIDRI